MAGADDNPNPNLDPFVRALICIGFDQDSATYLFEQDIDDTTRLLLFKDEEAVERMFESMNRRALPDGVTLPFMATKKVAGFRHWTAMRVRIGLEPDPDEFDNEEANAALDRMREEQAIEKANKGASPKKPDSLSSLSKWDTFWEQWTNYVVQLRGAAKIPLAYIHREHGEVTEAIRDEAEELANDEDAMLSMITLLDGEHYTIDNRRYYVEFKALIANGPGWPFIKSFDKKQDGRRAALALKAQCEGLSYRLNKKAQAYKKIRELSFAGNRRNWTLDRKSVV